MSLEEELAELSLVYHGQRELLQEARELLEDAKQTIIAEYGVGPAIVGEIGEWQERAKELLGEM